MMDDLDCSRRLERMSVFGLMKEAIVLMRQNVYLFLSFVTSFTIPCSVFTVFLLSAVDINQRYVISDFISKGELVILGWKFKTLISPLGLNFVFIILNLLPVALLNTVVCTRGVVRIYKDEDLTTSIKNSYIDLHWAVLRLFATQSLVYCVFVIILAFSLLPDSSSSPSYVVNIISVLRWVFAGSFIVLLYPIPASQVAILERRNYGFRGVYRALQLGFSRFLTALWLGFFSLSYFVLLKLLVDVLLKDSYPFWTKFLVYPPLVISVIAMSIFWHVVYTLFYLSCNINLDDVDPIQPVARAENRGPEIDVHQPLLADEVESSDESSSKLVIV
ncbi:hypothetical protein M758_2G240700 [Ceratodon purpureus]|nr:hypothetical protein M758_2G240700 [Ceratodon purpureus]